MPSIGLASWSASTRSRVALVGDLLERRQELVQRRVEQPDRHGQARHRLEDALRSRTAASAGAARAPRRAPRRSTARIISRTIGSRSSAMNMCSVRQRPMPSAPFARARSASTGVSRVRVHAEHPELVGPARGPGRGRGSAPARRASTGAEDHVAGGPVDRDHVSLAGSRALRSSATRVSRSTSSAAQPATHGLPMPRATTAACEVMPPRAVRTPSALIRPWMSSAVVSGRTRMTARRPSRARLPGRRRRSRCRKPRPVMRRARRDDDDRRRPGRSSDAAAGRATTARCAARLRARSIRPSSTNATAHASAAAAVRFAPRVCSRYSRSCSIVNSTSCMSR